MPEEAVKGKKEINNPQVLFPSSKKEVYIYHRFHSKTLTYTTNRHLVKLKKKL